VFLFISKTLVIVIDYQQHTRIMSGLKSLKSIVKSLRADEIDICKKYLTAFDRRAGKYDGKAIKLFELLLNKDTERSDEEIETEIYKTKTDFAFLKLQQRLKFKIYEILNFDANIERVGLYTERSQTLLDIRKRLNYAQIMQTRSLVEQALDLYNSIVADGVKFEHWEEVLIALRIKKGLIGISCGKVEYQKVLQDWKKYVQCYKASVLSESMYNKVILIANYRMWSDTDTIELREDIIHLTTLFEKTKSILVEYHLRFMEVHYYQQTEDYFSANKYLKRIVELSSKEKSVATHTRLSSAYLNLAQNDIYCRHFTIAYKHAQDAIRLVTTTHSTALSCFEIQFYACFYMGDYGKANTIIKKAIDNAQENRWNFQKGKWTYLMACCYFALGDFQQVDSLLLTINPIEVDKEGWYLGVRFLLMINNIERDKLDLASDRLANLRSKTKYLKKENNNTRHRLQFEILRELDRKSYLFNTLSDECLEKLEKLKSNEHGLKWKILSPELIIFHEWFACKIKNEPFKQTIPIQGSTHMLKVI
jgi:tetratricopeptide (TPR) repeat protein